MNRGRVETVGPKAAVYADPKTKSGAILTGCKNISRAQVLDEGHVRALDWGITLTVPVGNRAVTAVGIRSHTIAHGPGENSFSCAVADVIENPFSLTTQVRLQAAESGKTLGWELPTDRWQTVAGERVEIHLPAAAILLLHDEKEI
jgi:molybdate transport system ATP-binding protein